MKRTISNFFYTCFLLVTVALFSAAFLGCNECEQGFERRNALTQYEQTVDQTLFGRTSHAEACRLIRPWVKRAGDFEKDIAFANTTAFEVFYSEEQQCDHFHRELDCTWTDGSYPRDRRFCRSVRVCDSPRIVQHKADGFSDAINLTKNLTAAKQSLAVACSTPNMVEAKIQLTAARVKLDQAAANADQVLIKAGCYK